MFLAEILRRTFRFDLFKLVLKSFGDYQKHFKLWFRAVFPDIRNPLPVLRRNFKSFTELITNSQHNHLSGVQIECRLDCA